MKISTGMSLALLLLAGQAMALETGLFEQDDLLREKPKANAKVIANVDKGKKVELLRVKGKWYFVKIDERWTGWVPVSSVRRLDPTVGPGVGNLDSAGGASTTGAGSSLQGAKGSAFHP